MTDDYIQWLARLEEATQAEKDKELFLAIDLLQYEKVAPLIRAGADVDNVGDLFAWSVRRVQDFRMTNILLDLGFRADKLDFKDFEFLHFEDTNEYFKLLSRLVAAGLPFNERAKAAAHAASRGRIDIVPSLLRDGEDLAAFLAEAKKHDTLKKLANLDPVDIKMIALYHAHFAEGISQKKLKACVTPVGMTGYMLAVRAEKFDDVIGFYRVNPALKPDPMDMVAMDDLGNSVTSLLWTREKLPMAFAPALWMQDINGAYKLMNELPQLLRDKIDSETILRDIRQASLRTHARHNPSFKLKK